MKGKNKKITNNPRNSQVGGIQPSQASLLAREISLLSVSCCQLSLSFQAAMSKVQSAI